MNKSLAVDLLRRTLRGLEESHILTSAEAFENLKTKEFYELEDSFMVYLNYVEKGEKSLQKQTLEHIITSLSETIEVEEQRLTPIVNKVVE